jgi:MtrB/PioB family decaheme-associated outer membrane protein
MYELPYEYPRQFSPVLKIGGMKMKLRLYSLIVTLVMMLVPCSAVLADEAGQSSAFEGEVTATGVVRVNSQEATKFYEYADPKNALYTGIRLNYDNNIYFMRFNAGDMFYDTQKYSLDGGMWGKFTYNLFYNEIPHNITFGAKTFYSGTGSSSLDLKGNPDDVSTWSSFDYKTERKRFGAGISFDLLKPFFLNISAQTEKKEGIKPASSGDFGGVIELSEPIDYRTDTFRVEAGYSKKPFFASLSYDYSKFNNDNQSLDFFDVNLGGPNSVSLPPDNNYYKLAFKGAVFLPYNTKFSLNAGTSRAKSNADSNNLLGLKDFDGKVDTKNIDLVLTSNPISSVDGKIFYKYYDRENKSEGDEDHLGFIINKFGGQLGFRLPAHFRLTVGYTNRHTSYEDRYDAIKTTEDIYSADLAWSGLDFATFKIAYERMHRTSDRSGTDAVADSDTLWRFDVAPADRDVFKTSVELFPIESLSVMIGYKYKKTDYEDRSLAFASRALGLRNYKSDEFFVDASYAFAKVARVYGYFDYEKVRSQQYGFSSAEATDWSLNQKEKNYDYGIGVDFFIIPKKMTLRAQYDYVRSDGSADFSYLDVATPAGSDISNWGDYRKKALSIKALYEVSKSINLTAGYLYEQFKLDDVQLDGYNYRPAPTVYLTGAYKDQSYKVNVLFLNLSYKF